jgi:protein-disulfide isomerase
MITMAETNHKKSKEINKWKILSLALVVVLCISLFFLLGGGITGMSTSVIDPEEAAKNATDFINEKLVEPGTSASIVSVEDISGMYNVTLLYQDNEIPVYVTKDGKYVFLSAPVDIIEGFPEAEETEQTEQPTEVVKTDRPEAHAFIMSYCPYGLQFLKAYVPVIELLGDKADLEVNFVHYIMHGEKEATENTRMYCIQKEQNDKFTDYLRCFVESNEGEACVDQVGIDKTSLEACMQTTDDQFEITKTIQESEDAYPAYAVDAVLANQYGVGGSPTFVLNGVTISVNRAAESVKQAVCAAFNSPPAECDQLLSTDTEAPGAGPIGSGSGSDSSGVC